MSRLIGALLCGCLLAFGLGRAAHAGQLYPYEGNGSDGRKALAGYEAMTGSKAYGVTDFIAKDSWASFDSDAAWSIGAWKGYKLAESVPLTVNGTSLADVAAGKYDVHFAKLAALLVSSGQADAYIRLGWEMNGGWYPWAFKNHQADYIAAFRHVVGVMRSAAGQHFRIVWCPAQGMQQQWPDWSWPGDDVVDVVGLDVYNQSWAVPVSNKTALWNEVLNSQWGVARLVAFAKQHGKPYAFPEIGTGDRPDGHGAGDDPTFWAHMAPYIAGAEFAGPWDYDAGDYNSRLSTGERPLARAAFLAAFGTPTFAPALAPAPVATFTAKVTTGTGSVTITPNADGSAWLALSFPSGGHHVVTLSAARQLGWSATNVWFRGAAFSWDAAGTGKVWVGTK